MKLSGCSDALQKLTNLLTHKESKIRNAAMDILSKQGELPKNIESLICTIILSKDLDLPMKNGAIQALQNQTA